MKEQFIPLILGVTGIALYVSAAYAQDPAASTQELLRRIEQLEQKIQTLEQAEKPEAQETGGQAGAIEQIEQKIRILERKKEIDDEVAQAKVKEAPVVRAGKDGFGLRSPDGNFDLHLRGYVQADARFYQGGEADPAPDTFLMRRVRPIVEGTVFKQFGFRIMPDFGNGTASIQDAYVDGNFSPTFKVRAGKFKPPVGLERLQSGADLLLVERAFPTNLVPNRDVGVQFSGDVLNGTLNYAVGVFNGVIDGGSGENDTNSDKEYAVRLFAEPFKNREDSSFRGLGIGLALSVGDQSGSAAAANLPRFVTPGQQTFFSYTGTTAATSTAPSLPGAFADGSRERIAPQFYFYKGPFGLLGEYVQSNQEVSRGGVKKDVKNTAWQFAASWVLTGEDASFRGVNPREPFQWGQGSWGAFELAARVSRLEVDDDVFADSATSRLANPRSSAREATDYGIGLNWYFNRFSKLVLNYDQTQFKDGAAAGDRDKEKVLFTRFQVGF